jgi:general bacterial porin, GBP family
MFKKLVIAGAMATAVAGSALAQNQPSVEVFGRLDMGVINANNVGTKKESLTHITSSPVATSFLGFRGTENLGGGNSAGFLLESQINPADGTQGVSSGTGAANGVFARESNVFLRNNDLGTLRVGRQVMPIYQYFNAQDVRGGMGFGSSLVYFADGSTFGGTATSKTGISAMTGGTYGSNIASWQSPNWNGLTVRTMYGFGNTAGDLDYGQRIGVGALYDKGDYIATAGYYEVKSSTGVKTGQTQFLGGGYRITDRWIVRGGLTQISNPSIAGAANSKFDLKQLSTRYQVTSDTAVFLGHYQFNDKVTTANKSAMWSTGVEKDLSKRTKIYALVAQQNNSGSAGFSAYGGGGANLNSLSSSQYQSVVNAGAKQMAYGVGITHTF